MSEYKKPKYNLFGWPSTNIPSNFIGFKLKYIGRKMITMGKN